MIINRTLDTEKFSRFEKDFKFLKKLLTGSQGTLDLAIRDNYLNLYYRGYSLAKIKFKRGGQYEIRIHKKFWKGPVTKHKMIKPLPAGDYQVLTIASNLLHPLFQKTHLKGMFSAIKKVGTSEELVFEQMLITDNLERSDFFIIDRQVTDKVTPGRMDLLALRKNKGKGNKYHFVVLEVKIGKNQELTGAVAKQLGDYIKHIEANFDDYRKCYEEHYRQKKAYGLFSEPSFPAIEITENVEGIVLVGGYSVEAETAVKKLKALKKGIKVQLFKNIIK